MHGMGECGNSPTVRRFADAQVVAGPDTARQAPPSHGDHKFTAYMVNNMSNLGVYNSMVAPAIRAEAFVRVMMGTKDVQCGSLARSGLFSGQPPVGFGCLQARGRATVVTELPVAGAGALVRARSRQELGARGN